MHIRLNAPYGAEPQAKDSCRWLARRVSGDGKGLHLSIFTDSAKQHTKGRKGRRLFAAMAKGKGKDKGKEKGKEKGTCCIACRLARSLRFSSRRLFEMFSRFLMRATALFSTTENMICNRSCKAHDPISDMQVWVVLQSRVPSWITEPRTPKLIVFVTTLHRKSPNPKAPPPATRSPAGKEKGKEKGKKKGGKGPGVRMSSLRAQGVRL